MRHKFGDLLRPSEAAELLRVSTKYLSNLRQSEQLTEEIHYIQYSPGMFRYFSDALLHWAATRKQPELHREWILERSKIALLVEKVTTPEAPNQQ
jgi:hypothetical protein